MWKTKPMPAALLPRALEFAPPSHRLLAADDEPREVPLPHLGEVAFHIRNLSYGDMMKFARAIEADPDLIWKWANQ